ncbi:MAG TPA: cyclic nucleotide-binding domain-containing protein [Spirochaetia bacterium]|nr:cyclic nucleotide-binding domain-containing protein [Spirochaetia bacterium]
MFHAEGVSPTPINTIQMLRQISFFAVMSDSDLKKIARITAVDEYEADEIIIEELSEGAQFYIIHHGKVEVSKRYGDHSQFVLGVYSDGDFFGEMSLLDEGRRSATVRALEQTTLLSIAKNDFQPLLSNAPTLAFGILKELSMRVRTTGALLISYIQQRNRRLRSALAETLRGVMAAVERAERGPRMPFQHITALARTIGVQMGLSEEDLLVLELRSLLYDLGARNVEGLDLESLEPIQADDTEERTEPDERPLIEREVSHAFHGGNAGPESGFPDDFLGTDSYQVSIIISLAGAFSALTRDRPNGQLLEPAAAVEVIRTSADRWFGTEAVNAFLTLWEKGLIRTVDQ